MPHEESQIRLSQQLWKVLRLIVQVMWWWIWITWRVCAPLNQLARVSQTGSHVATCIEPHGCPESGLQIVRLRCSLSLSLPVCLTGKPLEELKLSNPEYSRNSSQTGTSTCCAVQTFKLLSLFDFSKKGPAGFHIQMSDRTSVSDMHVWPSFTESQLKCLKPGTRSWFELQKLARTSEGRLTTRSQTTRSLPEGSRPELQNQ